MKASETNLRALLPGPKQFVIPLYQRTYSWKRAQLERLWSDILELFHSDSLDSENHFLGPIVLAPSENAASGIQSWLVVDGQQRMTTLSILLAALRDLASDSASRLASKINDQYLVNEYADGMGFYTLLPTQADRPAWKAIVDRSPDAGGVDNIGEAYRFLRARIVQFILEHGSAEHDDEQLLRALEEIVVSRLSFVEISALPGDNVYRIFESLNNTGLKLTQADLLRNYLFMRLPENSDRVYEQHWLPLQNLLDEQGLVELIWLDLILRGNKRVTLHSIYDEQRRLLETLGSESAIEQWAISLHHKARVFHRILNPDAEPNSVIRNALDRLSRWKAKVVHPAALRILLAYEEDKLTPQEVSDSLRIVESYLVRQFIVGPGRPGSNVLLMDLVRSIGDKTPRQDLIKRILTGQRRRFPTDQQVRTELLEQPFYWRGKEWQKLFILRSLDEAESGAELVDYENSHLTIEHVMPQKLTDAWLQELKGDLGEFESAEEAHQTLVHTIGNLTLSGYNGSLSNKDFSQKRVILGNSGLAMNRSIASSQNWGVSDIRARSEYLAAKVIEIWPGPDDNQIQNVDPRLANAKQILTQIPAGCWTNLGSLAQAIGTHRRSIGKLLSDNELVNSHRVLMSDGSVPGDADDVSRRVRLLESEGIRFDSKGRASKDQYIDPIAFVYSDSSSERD